MDANTGRRRGGRPPKPEGARNRQKKTHLRDDEDAKVDALLRYHGYPTTSEGLREYLLAQAAHVPEAA